MKGERKFATCHGSFLCNNECTKWLTEKVRNRIDFRQAKGGGYTCKSCVYYVEREHCGALKTIEFEYSSQTVTIMHQGRHQTTRANWNMHRNKPLTGELKIDLIGYYLVQGDIEKAETAEK